MHVAIGVKKERHGGRAGDLMQSLTKDKGEVLQITIADNIMDENFFTDASQTVVDCGEGCVKIITRTCELSRTGPFEDLCSRIGNMFYSNTSGTDVYSINGYEPTKIKQILENLDEKNDIYVSNLYGNFCPLGQCIFQPSTKLWVWASSIPGVDKKHIKNILKLKSFSHLFESEINPKFNFYYQLLTQDVIQIPNTELLGWISELLVYLSDDIFVFTPTNNEGNTQFITLSKINEKYV